MITPQQTYGTALGIREMLQLLESARDHTCGVNELAEELGVSRRTIRRWAASLEHQLETVDDLPQVVLEPGTPRREAKVRLNRRSGRATLAQQRATALALATTRYLSSTGAEPLQRMAEQLVRRSADGDEATIRRLNTAFHYIPFGRKSYADASDEVDDVFTAVLSRWTIDFDYWRVVARQGIRVRAEPYSLVIYRDALYMLARRLGVGEPTMRVYAIDRMSQIVPDRNSRFEIPDEFNPADSFGDLGLWRPEKERERLEVLFEERTALFARERVWPGEPSDEPPWRTEPDGRHRLVLHLLVSPEVEQWLMGFGPDAEVVRPAWLRDVFRERATQMVERYRHPAWTCDKPSTTGGET